MRYLLILADGRHLHGDSGLPGKVLDRFYEHVRRRPELTEHMLRNTLHHKITLGVFGQLIRERYGAEAGGFDIKYGGYIPIVNGIRLLSIGKQIRECSTYGRIRKLSENPELSELADQWERALSVMLKLRLLAPCEMKDDGTYHGSSMLPERLLTKQVTAELKEALRIGKNLQKQVRK